VAYIGVVMKKSINLWAFPYPGQWTLKECLEIAKDAGFEGIELNIDLEGQLSVRSTPAQLVEIRRLAEQARIEISGICSFLFWPYSMTSNDSDQRAKGVEMAGSMIDAAALLGTENVLVVPGAVFASWVDKAEPVPPDVCRDRAREALCRLLPKAEAAGVYLNIENIFMNGFLFSPHEMREFVDSFGSANLKVHFDTGNISEYQFPEHWIPILGERIRNVHLKEWDRRSREFGLNSFRTLLDGTTNWPAVIEELNRIGYRGYLTFEYFHPFQHYPKALIHQTSDALDWILGRKT
jgi:L-ribulose-5-phosphate 3-epimerase